MEASLPVQRRVGSQSRIQSSRSRDGGSAAARRRGAAYRSRRSAWHRLLWRHHAPAPAVPLPRWRRPILRSSLKAVGSALARVACICKPPVCSGVHGGEGASMARSRRSPPVAAPAVSLPAGEWANWRTSVSLGMWWNDDDDVLMRRLVMGDEYATRRRMEMQEAARWSGRNWFPPGPSRLSQMSMADDADDDMGENCSSTSPQCSEDQSL